MPPSIPPLPPHQKEPHDFGPDTPWLHFYTGLSETAQQFAYTRQLSEKVAPTTQEEEENLRSALAYFSEVERYLTAMQGWIAPHAEEDRKALRAWRSEQQVLKRVEKKGKGEGGDTPNAR